MNIESYSDLEREIQRYQSEIEHLNDVQRQLNESNLNFDERNREQQSITNHMNNTNQVLNNFLEMQRAYNTFVNNLQAIKQIDIENASNKEEAQNRLETLQNEIIEVRKILPESLQREIRENAVANKENLNNNINYINEYENLINEYNQIIDDKDLDEIGLNDYDEIEKKYNEVSAKRDKLFEALNALEGQVSEEELNDLLGIDSGLKEKIDRDIDEFKAIKETKKVFKEEKEIEIQNIKDKIKFTKEQQSEVENTINQLLGKNFDNSIIEKYRDIVTKLQESISKDEKKLEELNSELGIILNGGKIEMTSSVDDVIKQTKIEEKKDEIEEQNKGQVKLNNQIQTESQTQTPGQTQVQPKVPNTLDNLVKNGKLPKNLSKEELYNICAKLNIQITDASTELSNEQIERLSDDHEIQVALLNQRIVERNQRKISEYDKLIAKYESILQDKMQGKEFSDEYVSKVVNLLEKTKNERQVYIDRNEKITAFDNSEVMGGISELRNGILDARASGINDELRSYYEKLDSLRKKREKSRSKFKQKVDDERIKKTLARIKKLKEKKSVLSDKQTQIVNKNAEKYISNMTKKIKKHLTRQGKVEISVDKINDLNERIERNNQERQNIAHDLQTETSLLNKIEMSVENKILQAQATSLQGQKNVEDIVGRLR